MRNNIQHIQIKTERLLLRPWMDSDLDDFFAYASIPIVGEMAGWKHSETRDEARIILRSDWFKNECLAMYHFKDKKVIGSVGLHKSWASHDKKLARHSSADIGYALHPNYWGRGITPEAVMSLVDFCFNHMDINLLTCGHFTQNPRSKRVIEKCGFTFHSRATVFAEQLNRHFTQLRYVLIKNS